MTSTWLSAYALTLGIEGAAAFLFAPFAGMARWRAGASAMLGSALSHPPVWFGALALYPVIGVSPTMLAVEAFAAGAEAVVYRLITRADWARCFLVSISVNALSWGAGVLVQLLK